MQAQSSSVESIPEAFEFDLRSNPTNSGMDQQHLWNSMLLNPIEPQSVSSYATSSVDANASYLNISNHDNAQSSSWSLGAPSSSHHPQTPRNHEDTKLEHGWAPPLSIGAAGGPRIEERNFESSNVLSLENANFNFNNSQVDGQPFLQTSSLNSIRLNSEVATDQVGLGSEVSDLRLSPHPYNSGLWNFEHHSSSIGSSNPHGSSSMFAESVQEDDGGNSGDGRRSACKRKNIEGFPGQSSTSGTASSFHQMEGSFLRPASYNYNPMSSLSMPNSLDYLPAASSTEDFIPGFAAPVRGMFSDCYTHANAAGNAESSRRNYRMRNNSGQLQDVSSSSLWSSNAGRRYNLWSTTPNQLASHSIPLNHSLEPTALLSTSASQSQPHLPVVPGLPQPAYHTPWNGAANLRNNSSSSSFNTEDRVIAVRDEGNSRNMSMASNLDFFPATDIAHLTQDPSNWSLGSRAINTAPSARASTSSGLLPPIGPTWLPHQSAPMQYPRSLSETIHQSLPSSSSSEPGGQASNFARPRSSRSYNSQEMSQPVRASSSGSQIRAALMMERQSESVWGGPLSMRNPSTSRETRNRMMLEIRHVLENMRRGQGLRFEDMLIIDQTLILAGADLHDRHREMRLDVDNMSYEELLALEEQIGNVSTGLSEETISKHLKQRKHSPGMFQPSMENEPCCICQEEYVEGEDIGTLECGHDFHTVCIKQWLTQKNLCPICKNTALKLKEKQSAIFGT